MNESKRNEEVQRPIAQRGITIISLIVTIIIMLILAGVTIDIATDGGLFDKAKEAVGQTENAIKQEQELVNEILDEYFKPNSSGDNTVKLPEGLKAGDYVNYTPTAGTYTVAAGEYGSGYTENQTFTTETGEAALKWRVLSIDEETGEIELVAATQSSTKLYLQGADGYNHAVDILNDLCEKLYSNENGAIARSINVEDINEKTTYDYTTYVDSLTGFAYGDTRQLSKYEANCRKYPNIYSQEVGYGTGGTFNTIGLKCNQGLGDQETDTRGVTTYSTVTGYTDGNTAGTEPCITYTYYGYCPENYLADLGINTAPVELLNLETDYWLASRCVFAYSVDAYFGVRSMSSGGEVCCTGGLFSSSSVTVYPDYAVRPVISLGSNVTLTKDTVNSTDEVTYWNIEYEL